MAAPVTSTLSSEFARYWRRVTRWIPIESGNYPYVTARVRAKKAALLSPDVYERMLQMEIPQIARVLSEGAYKTEIDRKSTRLNSSHRCISYAVFCLKKKKHTTITFMPSHFNTIQQRLE